MEVKGTLVKIPQYRLGKAQRKPQEDARPGEADLGNLSVQSLPPWQMVGKEANACNILSQVVGTKWTPLDSQILVCIKVVPPEE